MTGFEQPQKLSRKDTLQIEISALRQNKIANISDPEFALEIQNEIEVREAELRELETRH